MKTIQLHTAKAVNGGAFADAGSLVEVGDKPGQIDAKTARALVDDGLAVPGSSATAAPDSKSPDAQ